MRSRSPRPSLSHGFALGLVLLAFTAGSRPAVAYPLNPWGAHTPKGYVAVNPFLYVYGGPSFYPIVYVEGGLTDQIDLIGGVGGYAYSGAGGVDYVEFFPRYFINDSIGLTLHMVYGLPSSDSYAPNSLQVGPELHAVFGGDAFALTLNAGWTPSVVFGSGFQTGTVFVKAAPEYNFSSQFSLFLEVDPALDLATLGSGASPLSLTLVPGVGFALDEDQANTFSVGVQVVAADGAGDFLANNVSLGIWYAHGWGGE